jgi:DNA-binding NarL/FixJ family response regulator
MGYRIVLADDHPLFRDALRLTLQDALGDVRFDEAGSLKEAISILSAADDIDLVLLDLKMPGVQGFSGLVLVRSQFPLVPVVVVSGTEESAVIARAISLGASGFVPKSAPVQQPVCGQRSRRNRPAHVDADAPADAGADDVARRPPEQADCL